MRPHHRQHGCKRKERVLNPCPSRKPYHRPASLHGRTRPYGRVLLVMKLTEACATSLLHTTLETCGSISDWASFSSSLNCLFYGFKSIFLFFSFGFKPITNCDQFIRLVWCLSLALCFFFRYCILYQKIRRKNRRGEKEFTTHDIIPPRR